MAGIIACKDCIYLGTSARNNTKICRRDSPTVPVQQTHSGYDYVPATWPAVDPQHDGCGDGSQ